MGGMDLRDISFLILGQPMLPSLTSPSSHLKPPRSPSLEIFWQQGDPSGIGSRSAPYGSGSAPNVPASDILRSHGDLASGGLIKSPSLESIWKAEIVGSPTGAAGSGSESASGSGGGAFSGIDSGGPESVAARGNSFVVPSPGKVLFRPRRNTFEIHPSELYPLGKGDSQTAAVDPAEPPLLAVEATGSQVADSLLPRPSDSDTISTSPEIPPCPLAPPVPAMPPDLDLVSLPAHLNEGTLELADMLGLSMLEEKPGSGPSPLESVHVAAPLDLGPPGKANYPRFEFCETEARVSCPEKVS